MSRWRLLTLALLPLVPVLALMGLGSWFLYERGWWFYAWWPMAACLALSYFLGWRWQRSRRLLNVDFDVDPHWTDRDREAWKLVEARANAANTIAPERFFEADFYLKL